MTHNPLYEEYREARAQVATSADDLALRRLELATARVIATPPHSILDVVDLADLLGTYRESGERAKAMLAHASMMVGLRGILQSGRAG